MFTGSASFHICFATTSASYLILLIAVKFPINNHLSNTDSVFISAIFDVAYLLGTCPKTDGDHRFTWVTPFPINPTLLVSGHFHYANQWTLLIT